MPTVDDLDQLAIGIAADQHEPVAKLQQSVEHGDGLRPGGDVAGDHHPVSGRDRGFGEHGLEGRQHTMGVGQHGDGVDHRFSLPLGPSAGQSGSLSAQSERAVSLGGMADADDVRRCALALPQVTEIDSEGFDFRVAGKGFIWSYPERRPGQRRVIRNDIAVLFVGDEAEKQALLLGEPTLFFTVPGYDGFPLVMLRLTEVRPKRLKELITDAWRMRAPEAGTVEAGAVEAVQRTAR